MVERLQLNVERYARRAGNPHRLRQAAREHWQIVRALERKHVEKASALLEKHILNTAQDIAQKWQTKAQQPKGRGRIRRS